MENSEEAGDDQGSGWLQVKKKHRSSSKFSLPSLVSEFSGMQTSETMGSHCPMSNKCRNFDGRRRSYYPNAGTKFAKNSQESAANSTTVPTENEVDVRYQDKCVVNQDNECSKRQTVRTGSATFNGRTGDIVEVPQMIQKIKWGDLEDDALLLNCGNPVGVESQFGGASNANVMVCREPENAGAIVSCDASGSEPQQNILLETSLNTNFNPNQMASLSCKDESFQDNSKEVNELSAEDMKNPLMECSLVNLSVNPSNPMAFHEDLELSNDQVLNSSPLGENAETPVVLSEVGDLEISELPALNGYSNATEFAQESELLPSVKCEVETAGVSITSESLESSGYLKGNIVHDDLSKTQVRAGIAEGDANESKERFRERLWCFLFENLNRAVDELYLLCELECDLGQMKEAVLVLEEAACDFKDLNSRVEEFENMKRSSSQPKDGLPTTLKIDHRRPHALSWEVRRMTTSPHRAEILSSSLEAFKKIQQERASMSLARDVKTVGPEFRKDHDNVSGDTVKKSCRRGARVTNSKDPVNKSRKQGGGSDIVKGNVNGEKRNSESIRSIKIMQSARVLSVADSSSARAAFKDNSSVSVAGKSKKENIGFTSEMEKLLPKKGEMLTESADEKNSKYVDRFKRQSPISGKDKEMRNATSQKSMDAWKEKRNWEDILASPFRVSARASYLPVMNRRSVERARILHDKLMSPDKKKKTALDLKKEADEKHARATRIRSELENERVQKLQRTSEKLNRVNEWQAVRSMKLREGMYARHQRSESRHEAFLAQVVRRAGDESSKVNEVRFITSLNEENKKLILRQKLHDSKLRRDEKLQFIKTKQKEDMAREEAVLERRKLIEAEKLQRLAEIQRKKEEAQARKEEERKASSAAREAKATEQLRRKQARAKAQQEEAELLAQKLAERLSESEQRRKFYLEQIRERASMDFRDQSSPLLRHSLNKENQARLTLTNNGEDYQANNTLGLGSSTLATGNVSMQHPLKRRIKRIRQRLMALKHEYPEPLAGGENGGIGYRTALGTARAKIGRWLQELQRLRQARKEGAASIGLITAEMVKFFEGKEPELHASRQAGLLDFIASALPASHTSKPEACQVTIYLLRLLRVVLSIPANKNYFISQNLLPPIIPMLSASLENYIKMAASLHVAGGNNVSPSKTSENFESFSEVLNGFLWTVTAIIGHRSSDERQLNMQDGLLELVVVYQVIHRLRDLFALYDRPQVEGSPFPTSILLSIKLLTVLTSRPGSISSIDWESCPIIMERVTEIEGAKTAESAKSGNSSESDSSGDIAKCGAVSTFPDVPEDRPLGKLCKEDTNSELAFTEKGCVELNNTAIKSENENTDVANDQDDFKKKQTEDIARPLEAMKDEKTLRDIDAATKNENVILKQPIALLLSAISETGLVCLPSLLTAVLLQANNRLSSEQASYVLPSNFEEVATGVLKILNNLALVDLTLIQRILARPDLKMELFHLMSFLLSHCTSKWTKATDQVGLLLLESLSLLSYFALFHPGNQAVLRWGKSPTILHKVCDLPFVFFSDPELMPALAGTLVAACYGCEQNKGLIQQEISVDMLLSLLRSCRSVSPTVKSNPAVENLPTDDSGECGRRSCSRYPARKVASARGGALGNSSRACKARYQRENNSKGVKTFEVMGLKDDVVASNPSSVLMLHCRFPGSFVDKAEQFFSAET